jgi:hypothetical protein
MLLVYSRFYIYIIYVGCWLAMGITYYTYYTCSFRLFYAALGCNGQWRWLQHVMYVHVHCANVINERY